jgi:hypothetical protein
LAHRHFRRHAKEITMQEHAGIIRSAFLYCADRARKASMFCEEIKVDSAAARRIEAQSMEYAARVSAGDEIPSAAMVSAIDTFIAATNKRQQFVAQRGDLDSAARFEGQLVHAYRARAAALSLAAA